MSEEIDESVVTRDTIFTGDILVSGKIRVKVLGKVGLVFFLSDPHEFDKFYKGFTFEELAVYQFKKEGKDVIS